MITSGGSRLGRARLVAGGAVELRLAVRSVFRCLRIASVLRLFFLHDAGADHLCRVLAVVGVQPKPLRRHLLAVFSPLGDKDAGVGVLGDRRRTLDKGIFCGCQLPLGLLPECGQPV